MKENVKKPEDLPETEPETTTSKGIDSEPNGNRSSRVNKGPITIHQKDIPIGITMKGVLLKHEDHTKLITSTKGRVVVGGRRINKLTQTRLKFEDRTKMTTEGKGRVMVGGGRSSEFTHSRGNLCINRSDKDELQIMETVRLEI